MSPRERRLLILFLAAIFIMANFFGYKWLKDRREALRAEVREARQTLEIAEFAAEQRQSVDDEIDWIESNLPEPMEGELVPSRLQTEVTNLATRSGLTVNKPDILPSVEGGDFNRAQFQIIVTGPEQALYRWLTQVHSPKAFRAVTALRVSPNREDDTKIDATVTIEQYYVPKTAGTDPPASETALNR